MPDWIPPDDLRFDHPAAAQAITEIRRTRPVVVGALERQRTARGRAMGSWRGRTRRNTDEWLDHHHGALAGLVERLTELEALIEAAVDEAVAEQRRRDRLQERWWHELLAEQRATLADAGGP